MKTILKVRALGTILSLLLLCSCTTQNSVRPNLPAETSFNKGAGHGDNLYMTLRLESGEELLFVVDTGSTVTYLDKSLEPKLGKRLNTTKSQWMAYENATAGVYEAPKFYLGNVQLLTGNKIWTDDLKGRIFPGQPIMGVLGMDCLQHYCVQLDFTDRKIRFLDPDHLETRDFGQAFPLAVSSGEISTRANLFNIGDIKFRIDTGLVGGVDILLRPRPFQQELYKLKPVETGKEWTDTEKSKWKTLLSMDTFNGETYTNLITIGQSTNKTLEVATFSRIVFSGETYTNLMCWKNPWSVQNWIGLRFLARHLVTLDFPKQTMYLKQTSIGPL